MRASPLQTHSIGCSTVCMRSSVISSRHSASQRDTLLFITSAREGPQYCVLRVSVCGSVCWSGSPLATLGNHILELLCMLFMTLARSWRHCYTLCISHVHIMWPCGASYIFQSGNRMRQVYTCINSLDSNQILPNDKDHQVHIVSCDRGGKVCYIGLQFSSFVCYFAPLREQTRL